MLSCLLDIHVWNDHLSQVPFPELHGECTKFVGRAEDAIIAMSSYRLHIKFRESLVNVSVCVIFNTSITLFITTAAPRV